MRRRDCLKISAVSLTSLLAVAGCLEPGEGEENGEGGEEDGGGDEGDGLYNQEGEDGGGGDGGEGGGEKRDPPFDSSS